MNCPREWIRDVICLLAEHSGTQSTVVKCVMQSLFNDWFMASRTIPLHSNAWAVLMLFCWHVHSCQFFCNDILYQCLHLHTWLQPCVTFRIMPEAMPVLFVMKISKDWVDSSLAILTCMDLILVTRGFSLLSGGELNQRISGLQVGMKNKLYRETFLRN